MLLIVSKIVRFTDKYFVLIYGFVYVEPVAASVGPTVGVAIEASGTGGNATDGGGALLTDPDGQKDTRRNKRVY